MQRRNTVQKGLVLEAVRELHCHATAEEIYKSVSYKNPLISKGTVYRNLNILSEEGYIRRVEIPGEPDRFDHLCTNHHHAKCIKCGRVFDVELNPDFELTKNINNPDKLELLDYDIIFRAICPKCKSK